MHRICLLAVLFCTGLSAEERFRTRLQVDLDKDGRPETVRLVPYQVQGVTLGQLVVEDAAGRAVWKAPRVKAPYAAGLYRFLGEFDRGDLEFAADYDGDGRVDLVATEQKSDVRPTTFKVFSWDGKRFVHRRTGMLAPAPQKPATFTFQKENPAASRWIDAIRPEGDGFRLTVFEMTSEPSKARARWVPSEGFVLTE